MMAKLFFSKKLNLDMMHYFPTKKMDILHNADTDVFVIGTDILCIYRSNESGENIVSLSNFSYETIQLDLEAIFSKNLIMIFLSTTQDHVISGEYLARDFVMHPYEGVTFSFFMEYPSVRRMFFIQSAN